MSSNICAKRVTPPKRRTELDLSDFDFEEMIRNVVQTSQTLVTARGNTLVVESSDPIGIVHQDRTKLQQVLLNLIANASKFTDKGHIILRTSLKTQHGV